LAGALDSVVNGRRSISIYSMGGVAGGEL